MSNQISVVVSRGQSQNPQKRQLEDAVVEALSKDSRFDVLVVPNLYDVQPGGETVTRLRSLADQDLIVFSWLYERAAMWILQRNGIRGRVGEVLLRGPDDDEDDDEDAEALDEDQKQRVIDSWNLPDREIFCVNLQLADDARAHVEEAERIYSSRPQAGDLMSWIQGQPKPEQLERFLQGGNHAPPVSSGATQIQESAGRRWYPVIDFSRCTNCMECIDFCLFGVYGVDSAETILVEQPDNCRKGCPACSRVCPENAIIFPQHKTPAIAGAAVEVGALKIDLSKLFGAPDAIEVAAQERDEQLQLAGREAVGMTVGIPKRQEHLPDQPKDDLDSLIDELDDVEL